MSSARQMLADDLEAKLENDYTMVPDPRTIDNLDPGMRGTIQVIQADFKLNPIAPQAQYLERMHVWAITHKAEQPDAEDDLDGIAVEVTNALEALGKAAWTVADRMTHPDGHHAYRITTTYITDRSSTP